MLILIFKKEKDIKITVHFLVQFKELAISPWASGATTKMEYNSISCNLISKFFIWPTLSKAPVRYRYACILALWFRLSPVGKAEKNYGDLA